jgi:uncharacterized membrane protein
MFEKLLDILFISLHVIVLVEYVHLHFSDGYILIVTISILNVLGVCESLGLRHKELSNSFCKIGL